MYFINNIKNQCKYTIQNVLVRNYSDRNQNFKTEPIFTVCQKQRKEFIDSFAQQIRNGKSNVPAANYDLVNKVSYNKVNLVDLKRKTNNRQNLPQLRYDYIRNMGKSNNNMLLPLNSSSKLPKYCNNAIQEGRYEIDDEEGQDRVESVKREEVERVKRVQTEDDLDEEELEKNYTWAQKTKIAFPMLLVAAGFIDIMSVL